MKHPRYRHSEGITVLCVGGPLDGQDYTVKGGFRPSFLVREFTIKGTKIHEYLIDKLYADPIGLTPFDIAEPPYTFIAVHASLSREQAEWKIENDHMQKFVDSLVHPC
jgi:hypothetical protein